MKTIQFFHPEETFTYYIEKCFCKVVFSGQQHQLLIEIHSTDDLDHVEDDSLQNDFPQVSLTIDDFPLPVDSVEELNGQTVEIPLSFAEVEDEDGEIAEVFYTNINFSDADFEADHNRLSFFKNEAGTFCVKWEGEVMDFTEETEEFIPFEVNCAFVPQKIQLRD